MNAKVAASNTGLFGGYSSYESFCLKKSSLKPGYIDLHHHLQGLIHYIGLASIISPLCAGAWLSFSKRKLVKSPLAIATLLVGEACIANFALELYRIKKQVRLSVILDKSGPSTSNEINHAVRGIIAGDKPKIRLTYSGLRISGPTYDVRAISRVYIKAKDEMLKMNELVIPHRSQKLKANKLINQAYDCWLTRTIFPIAILNLVLITMQNPQNIKGYDYLSTAASVWSLCNYIFRLSVKESQNKLTAYLEQGKTAKEVMGLLISEENKDLYFVNKWPKTEIGVTINVSGSLVISKHNGKTYFGPYPTQKFPRTEKAPENIE